MIAFNASNHSGFFTTTLTFAHTTAGSDRYLFVHLWVGGGDIPTAVTYAGVSMTLLASNLMTGAAAGQWIRTYGLVNPASGTNNVIITFANNPGGSYISVVSYTGVNQITPTNGAGNNGLTSTTSLTTSLTTTVDNCWLAGYVYSQNLPGPGAATIFRGGSVNQLRAMDSGAARTPAGSHSLITTQSPADFAGHTIVALVPVTGGATSRASSLMLTGIGS